jgi:hypothetical protein
MSFIDDDETDALKGFGNGALNCSFSRSFDERRSNLSNVKAEQRWG